MENRLISSSILVIVPAFNEATVLRNVIEDLLEHDFSVVVVDDGSSDGTRAFLEGLPVHYIRHAVNLGQGAAISTGMEFARNIGFDYCVTFDADGQHFPGDILPMVYRLKGDALDILFGSRFLGTTPLNMSLVRKITLKIAVLINFFSTGIFLCDAHNGLRILSKKAVDLIRLSEDRMAHATEFLMEAKRLNLKYAEHPMQVIYSPYSIAKGQKTFNGFKVIVDIIRMKIFR